MASNNDYLPSREADLLNWSNNFNNVINLSPTAFGLTAGQCTVFGVLHTSWNNAYTDATQPSTRTPSAIQLKNDSKFAMINNAGGIRALVNIIQAHPGTTNQQRVDLGITVSDAEPSPVPAPATAPDLSIISIFNRTVKIRLRDVENADRRGKPDGVQGATILLFVGEDAPADPMEWNFALNTSTTLLDMDFPATIAAGAKVWLTAIWFNARKENSPPATPVSVRLSDGLAKAA